MNWKPINEIPESMKDGRPVWAKWHPWGRKAEPIRCGWVYWNGDYWTDLNKVEYTYITHYMPSAAMVEGGE